jgi:hypothetical protein
VAGVATAGEGTVVFTVYGLGFAAFGMRRRAAERALAMGDR